MNKVYGFEGEVKAKLGPGDFSFKLFTELFVTLPLATLISTPLPPLQGQDLPATVSKAQKSPILDEHGKKRFFVVHGGLFSKDDVYLKDIKEIDRHKIAQPGQEGLMMELLWSDPQAMNGRGPSKRGVGLGFGPDITRSVEWKKFGVEICIPNIGKNSEERLISEKRKSLILGGKNQNERYKTLLDKGGGIHPSQKRRRMNNPASRSCIKQLSRTYNMTGADWNFATSHLSWYWWSFFFLCSLLSFALPPLLSLSSTHAYI